MDNAFESESKKSFIEFARSLGRDRDRLVIQLNLAQKEVRDEWERIEDKWDDQTMGEEQEKCQHGNLLMRLIHLIQPTKVWL